MLKEYQIANFKPFAGPANIPVKPITLLFGPNSSGKSSILQSILMLKQTLEETKVSMEEAKASNVSLLPKGNIIDLGSYKEFVHKHDITRSFSFRMTFSPDSIRSANEDAASDLGGENKYIDILEKSINSCTVGLQITFSLDKFLNIFPSKADLYLGDDSKPVITFDFGEKDKIGNYKYKFIGNFDHEYWYQYWKYFDEKDPKFVKEILVIDNNNDTTDVPKVSIRDIANNFYKLSDKEQQAAEPLLKSLGILPSEYTLSKEVSQIKNDEYKHSKKESHEIGFKDAIDAYKYCFNSTILYFERFLPAYYDGLSLQYLVDGRGSGYDNNYRDVSIFALSAANLVRKNLNNIIYIAPLRASPERYYIYDGNISQNVTPTGLMLPNVLFNNLEIIDKVNKELERFGYDYELKVSRLMSEESEINDVFTLRLLNKSTKVSANLKDIGFGFSQVLPVIVQSLLSEEKILLIEQPELHLHPALQAELGDLFINSALSDQKNKFLIETHSEHLILRLLRRIRETTDGELPNEVFPITPEDLCILYVQSGKGGSEVIQIPVNEDGEFERPWPQGFFAERARELF